MGIIRIGHRTTEQVTLLTELASEEAEETAAAGETSEPFAPHPVIRHPALQTGHVQMATPPFPVRKRNPSLTLPPETVANLTKSEESSVGEPRGRRMTRALSPGMLRELREKIEIDSDRIIGLARAELAQVILREAEQRGAADEEI